MCQFFSCVSDGKGNVMFFTPEDVVSIMSKGNPEEYDFNSHTSLCHFKGILGEQEDKYNKWEYDPVSQTLEMDERRNGYDDEEVKKKLDAYFDGLDIGFIESLYRFNFGRNNVGTSNTGNSNLGHRNSGSKNNGSDNSGIMNYGFGNSGSSNRGKHNSGNNNSGWYNSGNMNYGEHNSGDMNKTNASNGVFCTEEPKILIFNKPSDLTLRQWINSEFFDLFLDFELTEWIYAEDMTEKEKENFFNHKKLGGFNCFG